MKPPIIPSHEQASQELASTIGRLFSAFSVAIDEASDYCNLKVERDRSFFSHHVRYLAKTELKNDSNDSFETQDADLEDTANSGICLVLPKYRVRVLRAAEDGQIPDPGSSTRRKKFLNQESEQYEFDWGADETTSKVDESSEPTHIVVLWEADSRDKFTGLWFICPNGTAEPHFKTWLPFPGNEDYGFGSAPYTPVAPTSAPAADIGFTKKTDKKSESPQKTGTDRDE